MVCSYTKLRLLKIPFKLISASVHLSRYSSLSFPLSLPLSFSLGVSYSSRTMAIFILQESVVLCSLDPELIDFNLCYNVI